MRVHVSVFRVRRDGESHPHYIQYASLSRPFSSVVPFFFFAKARCHAFWSDLYTRRSRQGGILILQATQWGGRRNGMNRKRIVQRSPIVVWSGVAVLFGIGIAYTPALGNGSTWTFPYAGIANSYSDVFDITNTGTGAAMWGYATSEYQGALNGKNYSAGGYGVQGLAYAAAGYGVAGIGAGAGLAGTGVGTGSRGVTGSGNQYGVYGSATDSGSVGVYGTVSGNGVGVEGVVSTSSNIGVEGLGSNSGLGVYAQSDTGNAFEAYTSNSTYACIYAYSKATGVGTFSYSASTGDGVYGIGGVGIHGGTTGQGSNLAGKFDGNVQI